MIEYVLEKAQKHSVLISTIAAIIMAFTPDNIDHIIISILAALQIKHFVLEKKDK